MDPNIQFHNGLKLLLNENSYIQKNNNKLIVELSDGPLPESKMTPEKINMTIFFLLENKEHINKKDFPLIRSITMNLIKHAGKDNELKNRIKTSFSEIVQSDRLNVRINEQIKTEQLDPQNVSSLEFYKERAASTGDPYIQYQYALLLEPEDIRLARENYILAADQGIGSAQLRVAEMYEVGIGGIQDINESFKYYKLAADQGIGSAQLKVAEMYDDETSDIHDIKIAFTYYKRAADQGIGEAEERVGVLLETGHGCIQDLNEAFVYFKRAANKNFPVAQERCGLHYELLERDCNKALHYYQPAAERGLPLSEHRLAILLISGKGGHKSVKEGADYLKRAADQGSYGAILDYITMVLLEQHDSPENVQMCNEYYVKLTETAEHEQFIEHFKKFKL
ncbi:MAG: sel1 repeat family protein [Verrucomicrobia bacterium]|nr:sel1 repeat family protein [Verrucomicrobiota bacterium]